MIVKRLRKHFEHLIHNEYCNMKLYLGLAEYASSMFYFIKAQDNLIFRRYFQILG